MYLTYEEYTEYGGTSDETAFNQLEFEARSVIDWWTFNRLKNETSYPEEVKRCMFKLISLIEDKQKALVVGTTDTDGTIKAGIIHEANDGVSADYNTLTAKEAVDTLQDELKNTINLYLQAVRNSLGQKVLYRGIYPNE